MPRNVGTVLQNNLSRGLITEATGLNFPENAVTSEKNTVFEKVGRVRRRKGIDVESSGATLEYEDSDGVTKEYVWNSVALTGGFTFLVQQIGWNIHFFELTVNSALSAGVVPNSIDLRDYQAPGATQIQHTPASFTSGAGYLFITHPNCDPVLVRFNTETEVFEVSGIKVLQRDFEGLSDGLSPDTEPDTLSVEHHYNLKNQGWNRYVRVGNNSPSATGDTTTSPTVNHPLLWEEL